jgi:hypothetical protein
MYVMLTSLGYNLGKMAPYLGLDQGANANGGTSVGSCFHGF